MRIVRDLVLLLVSPLLHARSGAAEGSLPGAMRLGRVTELRIELRTVDDLFAAGHGLDPRLLDRSHRDPHGSSDRGALVLGPHRYGCRQVRLPHPALGELLRLPFLRWIGLPEHRQEDDPTRADARAAAEMPRLPFHLLERVPPRVGHGSNAGALMASAIATAGVGNRGTVSAQSRNSREKVADIDHTVVDLPHSGQAPFPVTRLVRCHHP
jgi:hypothetical protein